MSYGVFIITIDADGHEHVGRLVYSCGTWTEACQYVRTALQKGELPDGTAIEMNGIKALELDRRPHGDSPKIRAGQVV